MDGRRALLPPIRLSQEGEKGVEEEDGEEEEGEGRWRMVSIGGGLRRI